VSLSEFEFERVRVSLVEAGRRPRAYGYELRRESRKRENCGAKSQVLGEDCWGVNDDRETTMESLSVRFRTFQPVEFQGTQRNNGKPITLVETNGISLVTNGISLVETRNEERNFASNVLEKEFSWVS